MKKFLLPMVLLSASALTLSVVAPVSNAVVGLTPAVVQAQETVSLKVNYGAPHGDKAFASTVVLMAGDTIVDLQIDEFQYVEGDQWTGVPNSKAAEAFGAGAVEGVTLVSKRADAEGYSAMMAEIAGSTVSYDANLDAIEEAVKGKTVAEVEALIEEVNALGEDGSVADVISGATLADTAGYLQTVVDAANSDIEFAGVEVADPAAVTVKQSVQAPHGDKAFAIITVALEGDKVVATAMDEFQYLSAEDAEGVPNADGAFGESFAEGVVLASKLVNNDLYSAMMAEHAGSTVAYVDNFKAITEFANGKTVAELEEAIAELQGLGEDATVADVVSGSTLVDTAGYLQAIVDTANDVAWEAPVVEEAPEEEAEEETEEAAEGEETEAVVYTDGTYTASTEGHNGPLEVEVVVEGGVITAVNVLNHEETEGISDPALADVPAAIVENNSTDVEVVSGASVSSKAIIEAVKAALEGAQ